MSSVETWEVVVSITAPGEFPETSYRTFRIPTRGGIHVAASLARQEAYEDGIAPIEVLSSVRVEPPIPPHPPGITGT